jgi:hypothetical protein
MLDFLGIGSYKAATTWLFKRLAMHPDTYFPFGKEAHYWDQGRFGPLYLKVFGQAGLARANEWKSGEITPAYAYLPTETIGKIRTAFPEAKVFMTVRDPTDRVMSSLKMQCRAKGIDPSKLSTKDLRDMCREGKYGGQLEHGRYAVILPKWMEYYPIKIILWEDIADMPLSTLNDLCRHIGIDDTFFDQIPEHLLRQRVHVETTLPVPQDFRAWVIQQSEPDIRAVEELTGRDLSVWRH